LLQAGDQIRTGRHSQAISRQPPEWVYFAVTREGEVQAGDRIEKVGRDGDGLSVEDIVWLFAFERDDLETLRRAVQDKTLPESWSGYSNVSSKNREKNGSPAQ
jgi:MOSC domain-containing protein YiiM